MIKKKTRISLISSLLILMLATGCALGDREVNDDQEKETKSRVNIGDIFDEDIDPERASDLYDHTPTKDDKYLSDKVVKISSDYMDIVVEYDGENRSGVNYGDNNKPEIYGELIGDAEYISGGGPKPPENNYYLQRLDSGWYTIIDNIGRTNIRIDNDPIYSMCYTIEPSDYDKVDQYNYDVSFNLNGDIKVESDDTEAVFYLEIQNTDVKWIDISRISVNTLVSNKGEYYEFVNNIDGDMRVSRFTGEYIKDQGYITEIGYVTLTKGETYRIYIDDMHIEDEDGNEVKIMEK